MSEVSGHRGQALCDLTSTRPQGGQNQRGGGARLPSPVSHVPDKRTGCEAMGPVCHASSLADRGHAMTLSGMLSHPPKGRGRLNQTCLLLPGALGRQRGACEHQGAGSARLLSLFRWRQTEPPARGARGQLSPRGDPASCASIALRPNTPWKGVQPQVPAAPARHRNRPRGRRMAVCPRGGGRLEVTGDARGSGPDVSTEPGFLSFSAFRNNQFLDTNPLTCPPPKPHKPGPSTVQRVLLTNCRRGRGSLRG